MTEDNISSLYLESSTAKITLFGRSIAGICSGITIPELDVCFDMGFCSDVAVKQSLVLVSHSHIDHFGALHMHAFNRKLAYSIKPTYVLPTNCAVEFENIYDIFDKLNYHVGQNSLGQMRPFSIITELENNIINKKRIMRFKTNHPVESYAYKIIKIKKNLRKEFVGLDNAEIQQLKVVYC